MKLHQVRFLLNHLRNDFRAAHRIIHAKHTHCLQIARVVCAGNHFFRAEILLCKLRRNEIIRIVTGYRNKAVGVTYTGVFQHVNVRAVAADDLHVQRVCKL